MKKPHKPNALDYAFGAVVAFLLNAAVLLAWIAAWSILMWLIVASLGLFQ